MLMGFRPVLTMIVGFCCLAKMSHSLSICPQKELQRSRTPSHHEDWMCGGGWLAFLAAYVLPQVALSSCGSLRMRSWGEGLSYFCRLKWSYPKGLCKWGQYFRLLYYYTSSLENSFHFNIDFSFLAQWVCPIRLHSHGTTTDGIWQSKFCACQQVATTLFSKILST